MAAGGMVLGSAHSNAGPLGAGHWDTISHISESYASKDHAAASAALGILTQQPHAVDKLRQGMCVLV